MSVDAFVIQYGMEPSEFRQSFLGSPDFTMNVLKSICRELELPVSGSKDDLASRTAYRIEALHQNIAQSSFLESFTETERRQRQLTEAQELVIQNLVARDRDWVAFKICNSFHEFKGHHPSELIDSEGDEDWYGPIHTPSDLDAVWYIRPVHVPHWTTLNGSGQAVKAVVRWLCLARFKQGILSIHWRGFSHATEVGQTGNHNSQFRYWDHVPGLIQEIEGLSMARSSDVNLHNLILYKMWDEYRYDEAYDWKDRRIRAESGGVVLSAHSGAVAEIGEEQIGGIRHLANMIRQSVEREMLSVFHQSLPQPYRFDEVILRTLIREFGTLSYELSLRRTEGDKLLRAHCYFGLRQERSSPDIFPHVRFFSNWRDVADQFTFLVDNLGEPREHQLEQLSIFSG